MSRLVTLTGLALRELWISFRLLLLLGLLLLAAMPPALLPQVLTPDLAGAPPDPLTWFAVALAVAISVVSAVAAATFAAERGRGAAGWVVLRAVPRPTILLAWLAAFTLLLVAGLVPAGALTWISVAGAPLLFAAGGPFAAALLATACAGVAAIALGLLAGGLLPPLLAGALTLLIAGGTLLAAALGEPPGMLTLPAGGLSVLATLDEAARPVADSLRAAGAALATAAVLLAVAAAGFERADL